MWYPLRCLRMCMLHDVEVIIPTGNDDTLCACNPQWQMVAMGLFQTDCLAGISMISMQEQNTTDE